MKKDIRIDGKLARVFVLAENNERIVYIPIKALNRVHYDQLTDISNANPTNMLEEMRKTKLSNGRNALTVFDAITQVLIKETDKEGSRLPKPDEAILKMETQGQTSQPVQQEAVPAHTTQPVAKKPATQRKKPGTKPKNQQ